MTTGGSFARIKAYEGSLHWRERLRLLLGCVFETGDLDWENSGDVYWEVGGELLAEILELCASSRMRCDLNRLSPGFWK